MSTQRAQPAVQLRRPLRAIVVCNNDMMARQLEKLIDLPFRESADKTSRVKELRDIHLVVSMRRCITTDQHKYWQAWAKKQGIPYIAANSGALLNAELRNVYGLKDEDPPKQEKKTATPAVPARATVSSPTPAPAPAPTPAPVTHIAVDPISVALRAVKEEYEKQLEQAKRDVDAAEYLALKESEKKDDALIAYQKADQQVLQLTAELSSLMNDVVPVEKIKAEMHAEMSARDKKINELVQAERKAEERLAKISEQAKTDKANMDRMKADLEIALEQAQSGTTSIDSYALVLLELLALYLAKRPVFGKDIQKVIDTFIVTEPSLAQQLRFAFKQDLASSVHVERAHVDTALKDTLSEIVDIPGGNKMIKNAIADLGTGAQSEVLRSHIKSALRAVKAER